MRKCYKCQKEKDEQKDFYKSSLYKNRINVRFICKECDTLVQREKQQKLTEEQKEKQRQKCRDYYQRNRLSIIEKKKQYFQDKKEQILPKRYKQIEKRKRTDPNFRFSLAIRQRFNKALHGEYKKGSAVKALGCSIKEAREHIEKQFQPGMTWDNYGRGKGKWNIDHKIPLDYGKNQEQKLILCHYANLQPLWTEENSSKQNKLLNT